MLCLWTHCTDTWCRRTNDDAGEPSETRCDTTSEFEAAGRGGTEPTGADSSRWTGGTNVKLLPTNTDFQGKRCNVGYGAKVWPGYMSTSMTRLSWRSSVGTPERSRRRGWPRGSAVPHFRTLLSYRTEWGLNSDWSHVYYKRYIREQRVILHPPVHVLTMASL
jgi:hypothetical protein